MITIINNTKDEPINISQNPVIYFLQLDFDSKDEISKFYGIIRSKMKELVVFLTNIQVIKFFK